MMVISTEILMRQIDGSDPEGPLPQHLNREVYAELIEARRLLYGYTDICRELWIRAQQREICPDAVIGILAKVGYKNG